MFRKMQLDKIKEADKIKNIEFVLPLFFQEKLKTWEI